MDSENLIRMANRIGDFFEAMPERDAALEGIAGHLGKFWEPRMRREFLALADNGALGLSAIVRAAVERHRGLLGMKDGGAG